MTSQQKVTMKPVGYVRTQASHAEVKEKNRICEIEIQPEFSAALDGVADYSHLYVLFWLHEVPEENRMTLKVHPRGRADLPLVGVFAARTNHRPNPIGLTVVELLKVKGNVLTIRGLDAYNGSPVLDIKPYDYWAIIKEPKVPNWWRKLDAEKKNEPQL
ncbi:MAG: tRNA (N6-threonylcarbamoyladenosine(37)-N6)-methyltransferase TrmO [Candidatus Bathyarchaeota archaeon]|nr:tRNA (N6-threonylcarbamoyladenosine(37)-N6)-methyltransferase TrmO [Candidatus Bathyarchaeota archaeon]